jgi:hypothetical protein
VALHSPLDAQSHPLVCTAPCGPANNRVCQTTCACCVSHVPQMAGRPQDFVVQPLDVTYTFNRMRRCDTRGLISS